MVTDRRRRKGATGAAACAAARGATLEGRPPRAAGASRGGSGDNGRLARRGGVAARMPGDEVANRYDQALRYAGPLLAMAAVAAVLGFGLALPGYLPWSHPVALLGARGMPHAWAFDLLAFVLPGALAALLALRLLRRAGRGAPWALRVGGQVLLLAGLAFAGMGLLPLDPADLESRATRLHASAWLLWVVALAAAASLLAAGAWRRPGARGWARTALAVAVLAALGAFALDALLSAAVAQRLVFALWWAWLALLACRPGPYAAPGRG